MKRIMIALVTVAVAASVMAAGTSKKTSKRGAAAAAVEEEASADEEIVAVSIKQYPKLGKQALLQAPSIVGGSTIGQCYKKPRSWIVLEAEYYTPAKVVDQLTFTWHVVLETKSASNKDRVGQQKLAPYSYFTQTTTYNNIPRGSHAASVCLHPSYYECFGEPVAVAIVVTDKNGKELAGDVQSGIGSFKGKKKGFKFWEEETIMNAPNPKVDGGLMVERRQGLQDRSKTIWALVNPNDYELTIQ